MPGVSGAALTRLRRFWIPSESLSISSSSLSRAPLRSYSASDSPWRSASTMRCDPTARSMRSCPSSKSTLAAAAYVGATISARSLRVTTCGRRRENTPEAYADLLRLRHQGPVSCRQQEQSPEPEADEQDADVLSERQAEVAPVGVRDVRGAEEVEAEAPKTVEQSQQRQEVAAQQLAPGQCEYHERNRSQQQGVVEAEIVPGTAGKRHGERKARQAARM